MHPADLFQRLCVMRETYQKKIQFLLKNGQRQAALSFDLSYTKCLEQIRKTETFIPPLLTPMPTLTKLDPIEKMLRDLGVNVDF